jgi:hypothetical protein
MRGDLHGICAVGIYLLRSPSDHSTTWHGWIKCSEVRVTQYS